MKLGAEEASELPKTVALELRARDGDGAAVAGLGKDKTDDCVLSLATAWAAEELVVGVLCGLSNAIRQYGPLIVYCRS